MLAYTHKSYIIFKPPAKKNGKFISIGFARSIPQKVGEIDAPIDLDKVEIPAAADLSSSETSSIVRACRVGTSICEMLNLNINIPTANGRPGIIGININKIFDGRWVKTIVLSNPIRFAILAANSAEIPATKFVPKNIFPSVPALKPNFK